MPSFEQAWSERGIRGFNGSASRRADNTLSESDEWGSVIAMDWAKRSGPTEVGWYKNDGCCGGCADGEGCGSHERELIQAPTYTGVGWGDGSQFRGERGFYTIGNGWSVGSNVRDGIISTPETVIGCPCLAEYSACIDCMYNAWHAYATQGEDCERLKEAIKKCQQGACKAYDDCKKSKPGGIRCPEVNYSGCGNDKGGNGEGKEDVDWCDVPPSSFGKVAFMMLLNLTINHKEHFWDHTHCLWHCLGTGRSWRFRLTTFYLGVAWEGLEIYAWARIPEDFKKKAFPDWITPGQVFKESFADIFFNNMAGILCGMSGYKTLQDCWCCCCEILWKKKCNRGAGK